MSWNHLDILTFVLRCSYDIAQNKSYDIVCESGLWVPPTTVHKYTEFWALKSATNRHFGLIEVQIVDSSTRLVYPSFWNAVNDDLKRHLKVNDNIRHCLSVMQSFGLLQVPRETWQKAFTLDFFHLSVKRSRSATESDSLKSTLQSLKISVLGY